MRSILCACQYCDEAGQVRVQVLAVSPCMQLPASVVNLHCQVQLPVVAC